MFNLLLQNYYVKYLSKVDECQLNPVTPKILKI